MAHIPTTDIRIKRTRGNEHRVHLHIRPGQRPDIPPCHRLSAIVKRNRPVKHLIQLPHMRHIPTTHVLVKHVRRLKHRMHLYIRPGLCSYIPPCHRHPTIVKRIRIIKHIGKLPHMAHIPTTDIRIKRTRRKKHRMHFHIRRCLCPDIPPRQRHSTIVKRLRPFKHLIHLPHVAQIPATHILVKDLAQLKHRMHLHIIRT